MGLKVLVVDDEKDIRSLLDTYLTSKGYSVYTASTLAEGLKLISETSPDILFLDNNLPDGLGWDNIETIQQTLPSCKINLISAYQSIPGFIKNNPTIGLIEKPISFASLQNYL